MYAVIKTGAKQYRVTEGETLRVERLAGTPGDDISFDEVLLVSRDGEFRLGRPLVEGARVRGTIVEQDRNKKIIVFKMKRRKGYRRKQGHRQSYTGIKVNAIEA